MEKKLKELFEYQRFAKNPELDRLIRQTENRFGTELSDDDLSFVNAAGDGSSAGTVLTNPTGFEGDGLNARGQRAGGRS